MAGSDPTAGFAMPYAVTAAFIVLLVAAGFGTAIFAGYEIARLVASTM
jgi:hypothetical protein